LNFLTSTHISSVESPTTIENPGSPASEVCATSAENSTFTLTNITFKAFHVS
jgi:hypothetical protein